VKVNIYHTYDSDCSTLIARTDSHPLSNRHGGSSNNILGPLSTTPPRPPSPMAPPPSRAPSGRRNFSGFSRKSPNGTWRLEIRDYDRRDGGRSTTGRLVVKPIPGAISPADAASATGLSANLLPFRLRSPTIHKPVFQLMEWRCCFIWRAAAIPNDRLTARQATTGS